jgi:hypothetical protein
MKLIRYLGDFVACKAQMPSDSRIATAREGILDRIRDITETGKNSLYFQTGNWHPEGTARINRVNYWCLHGFAPTSLYAQAALDANKANRYLSLTEDVKIGEKPALEVIPLIAQEDAEKYPKNPEKRRVLNPSRQETFSADTSSLGDVDIAVFLARNRKLAEKYGEFLKNKCGINSVTFYQLPNSLDNVTAGFWLGRLSGDYAGNFGGGSRYFYDCNGSLLGVRDKMSAEGGREISAGYSGQTKQIKGTNQAIKDFRYLISGKARLEDLKEDSSRAKRVLRFLEGLRAQQ